MKVFLAFSAFLTCATSSAVAAEFCAEMRLLGTKDGDISLSRPDTSKRADCTRSLMLEGGTQLHCGWTFPYRAPSAAHAFEQLVDAVTACLGPDARVTADLNVNHPDFYDLQTFQLEGQEIGVSLKDKAALSETYVFLRVSMPKEP